MTDPLDIKKAISVDGFLDGRLQIAQPGDGYRAGTDSVLLGAACPAKSGDVVLDVGCGVGTAALCLGWRVADLTLIGLELDPIAARLARDNATRNQTNLQVVTGNLFGCLPPTIKQLQADHVITNPPYFVRGTVCAPDNAPKERAWVMARDSAQWIKTCLKRVRPKGSLSVINRVEQLPVMLRALDGSAGAIEILPICARAGCAASRVIVRAIKSSRAPVRLLSPLQIHDGAHHNGDDFSADARAILREGKALSFGG